MAPNRLEMKGKYQELAPLLKRVNQISTERKRYENDLKRLLQELEKTKLKLNTAHQSFKCLVEELTRKKEEIDRGLVAVACFVHFNENGSFLVRQIQLGSWRLLRHINW